MRAVIAVVLAVAIIAVVATSVVGAEVARRQAPSVTPTFIQGPRVVLLRCVEEMDGFHCEEVTESEICPLDIKSIPAAASAGITTSTMLR